MSDHWIHEALYKFTGRHPGLRPHAAAVLNAFSGNRLRIRGEGNRLECRSSFLRNVRLTINGDHNTVCIGGGSRIADMAIAVSGSGHTIQIGSDCCFKGGSICFEDCNGRLVIGADTTIERADIAVTEAGASIVIGRDCMLAFGIDIRCGDSHAIFDRATGERINAAADITIGDHVWLGVHTQVLKGGSIGEGSVIGARSVVTGVVPPGVVAAGIPARVVREGIVWRRQR